MRISNFELRKNLTRNLKYNVRISQFEIREPLAKLRTLRLEGIWKVANSDSPQRRRGREGGAESSNQISAPPLRSLRLCGESHFKV